MPPRQRLTNQQKIFLALKKSFYWNIFSGSFGLINLLLIVVLSVILSNFTLKANIERQVQQLVFLFFSVGITSSLGIDYAFLKKKYGWEANLWIFGIGCLILLFGVCVILLSLLKESNVIDDRLIKLNINIQYIILTFSFVYSLVVKTFLFVKE